MGSFCASEVIFLLCNQEEREKFKLPTQFLCNFLKFLSFFGQSSYTSFKPQLFSSYFCEHGFFLVGTIDDAEKDALESLNSLLATHEDPQVLREYGSFLEDIQHQKCGVLKFSFTFLIQGLFSLLLHSRD